MVEFSMLTSEELAATYFNKTGCHTSAVEMRKGSAVLSLHRAHWFF